MIHGNSQMFALRQDLNRAEAVCNKLRADLATNSAALLKAHEAVNAMSHELQRLMPIISDVDREITGEVLRRFAGCAEGGDS